MKKIGFAFLLMILSLVMVNAQIISKSELDNITLGLPIVKKEIVFNSLNDFKYIDFHLYSRLISNYANIDSVFSLDQKNVKYLGAWSGYIEGETSFFNIDNHDFNGDVILGAPTEIYYHNKISLLGKVDIGQKNILLLIKVKTYSFFVIHLFSFDNDGKLISVIPVGKVETSAKIDDWFVIQKGLINNDSTIFASYLAEAYVELTYAIKNGHFKVINEKTEE